MGEKVEETVLLSKLMAYCSKVSIQHVISELPITLTEKTSPMQANNIFEGFMPNTKLFLSNCGV